VSILFADIKELDGKNYGQMLIVLPRDATEALEKVSDWLTKNRVKFSLETAIKREEENK
jgi:ABC-type methionine transport system ATPase subunit